MLEDEFGREVTGGRATEFAADTTAAVCRLAPDDATQRGIESGDEVRVTDGETALSVTARVDEGTRAGTVYLPAAVADPLLRSGDPTVDVRLVTDLSERSR